MVRPFLIGQHTNNMTKGVDEEFVLPVTTVARIHLYRACSGAAHGRGETKPVDVRIPTISTVIDLRWSIRWQCPMARASKRAQLGSNS